MSNSSVSSDARFNHAAIFLIAVALAVFLGWQIKQSLAARAVLQEAIEQRGVIVSEAQANQARTAKQLEVFLTDLLALAETNPQAKALVDRYGIRRQSPSAQPALPPAM